MEVFLPWPLPCPVPKTTVISAGLLGSPPQYRWQNGAIDDGKGDHDLSWTHPGKQQAPARVLPLAIFSCVAPQRRAGEKGHPLMPSSGKWSRAASHFCHLLLAQGQQGGDCLEHWFSWDRESHQSSLIKEVACGLKRQIENWSTMQCFTSILKFPFTDFYTEVIQLTSALYYGHLNHTHLQAWCLSKMSSVLKENGPLDRTT